MNWFGRARRARLLERHAIPPAAFDATVAALPILRGLDAPERTRLREAASLFIHDKTFSAAGGADVDDATQYIIALQACLLTLNVGNRQHQRPTVPGLARQDVARAMHHPGLVDFLEVAQEFVGIENDLAPAAVAVFAGVDACAQILKGRAEVARPGGGIHAAMQRRKAVGVAVQHVELVRELVQHHVDAVGPAAGFNVGNRQHQRPRVPGLPRPGVARAGPGRAARWFCRLPTLNPAPRPTASTWCCMSSRTSSTC